MFISCGDVLVDLFNQPTDTVGQVALAGHVGGSPFNVAVGLSRMGNETGFLCKNSTDFIGQLISNYMDANRIKPDWVVPTALNSTLAMIRKNADGSANYAFYTENTADVSLQPGDLPAAFPASLDALHFASYSTTVGSGSSTLLGLAQREASRHLISYDPNCRPSIEPDADLWRETFSRFSSVAGFVKASDEDIHFLFGEKASFENFAADTLSAGASVCVVTEGGEGATVYSADGQQYRSKPISITVADTVGAGDTFQAASLHWLKAKGCIQECQLNVADVDLQALVDFAAEAAAITCTRHGADLPHLQDLPEIS